MSDGLGGQRLGPYTLQRELGRGSTGVAYFAVDTRNNAPLCVKLLHPGVVAHPELLERARREITLTSRISHPGVCRLYALERAGTSVFITMEYAEGAPLHELLKNHTQLPLPQLLAIGRAMCAALTAAHDVGVIHRDLKPGNVIVNAQDEVKLLDFGLAKATDLQSSLTTPGMLIGTRSFIAPEVWLGNPATAKSDQYALGVVLYKAATGQLPYPQKDAFLLNAMLNTAPPAPRSLRPDIPALLEAMIMRILSPDPERRFEDVRALGLVLGRVAAAPAPPSPSPSPSLPPPARPFPPPPGSSSPSLPAPPPSVEDVVGALLSDAPVAPAAVAPLAPGAPVDDPRLWSSDVVESGLWVVNGQAVGGPIKAKVMEVPLPSLSATLEPEELPLWDADAARGSRLLPILGALVALFVAVATAYYVLRGS